EILYESNACYMDDDEDTPSAITVRKIIGGAAASTHIPTSQNPFFAEKAYNLHEELEIDEGGGFEANAKELLKLANSEADQFIYCKSDGSLSEGFEIVSHPFTLDYHINEFPSDDASCRRTGLFISQHRYRRAAYPCQPYCLRCYGRCSRSIARILYFMEANWRTLRFS
ncbi:MAG: hypothetical protein V8Q32_00590, partial [Anaerotignum faecicola]